MNPASSQPRITQMIEQASNGDREARQEVIGLIYDELHRLAAAAMSRERQEHLLQATALVNEAYLKLFEGAPLKITDRNHFFNLAARQMRLILVDHARRGSSSAIHVPMDELFELGRAPEVNLLEIDELLKRLDEEDPDAASVVEQRFFGGYTEQQTAEILNRNVATVRRDWAFAKAWLYRRLTGNIR